MTTGLDLSSMDIESTFDIMSLSKRPFNGGLSHFFLRGTPPPHLCYINRDLLSFF